MKNILLACFFSLTLTGAFGQDQWTMFSKVTADWCPNCGTYGWSMMEDGMEAVEGKNVLVMNLHHSGGLTNQTAQELVDNLQTFSQPRFFINNDDMGVSSSNVSGKIDELVETVDLLNSFAPFATVRTSAIYNGSSIETQSDVEFMETSDGNYFLASYLVKDNIVHNQSQQGPNAIHPMVVMDALGGATFGTSFATPVAMQGMTFTEALTYEIEIADEDLSDYYIATVIWNFLETTQSYRFFNATRTNIINQASSVDDNLLSDAYDIKMNNKILSIETADQDDYTLTVVTTDGRVLAQNRYNGNTTMDLNHVNTQMIVVNLAKDGKQTTQRFIMN